jgi:hypothetical protein
MSKAETFFRVLLLVYPREFRNEYEREMLTVFRDCYRVEEDRGKPAGICRLWGRLIFDVVQSAPKEHFERFEKENFLMKNLRSDAIALIGCISIIVVAFALLTYGRNHEVASILVLGFALDALVTAGVLGNLIVFLLVKTTRLNPLRLALWTFLTVTAVEAVIASIIDSRVSSPSRPGAILIGHAISFLFWFGIHWLWAQRQNTQRFASGDGQ